MKRILIIEDDSPIAELERDYLELEGYQIHHVIEGQEGLKQALSGQFDLIILDIMLPGLDGFSLCRQLRKELEVPIIMVSAKREDMDKIRGLGVGADDYIVKPFNPSELVARVKARLNRFERVRHMDDRSLYHGGSIVAGHLEIHMDLHQVYLGGLEINLTPREYDILLLLASNPNRVFRKDEIFERLWGLDALGEVGTVMTHINRLRSKIDKQYNNEEYIDTVCGIGYRFHKWDNYKSTRH